MTTLQNEFAETEKIVAELATTFSDAAKQLQQQSTDEAIDDQESSPSPKRRRRKHGTELTLDD